MKFFVHVTGDDIYMDKVLFFQFLQEHEAS